MNNDPKEQPSATEAIEAIEAIEHIRELVTTDHESKEAFIRRVKACLPNQLNNNE